MDVKRERKKTDSFSVFDEKGNRYVTPSQKHSGEEKAVLRHRKEVYEKAKDQKPSRWTGTVRNWNPIKRVVLNPVKDRDDCLTSQGKTA